MDLGLKDKVVLVTGGGRGIGAAISKKFVSAGAKVIITDISEDNAVKTLEEIKNTGGSGAFYPMNVANSNSVTECIKKVLNDHQRVDILINNAGVTRDNLLIRMKEEDWDLVMNVNLKGAFNCTKAVASQMFKSRWGRIVNIASVVGVTGNKGQANYSASKAGLVGFTKSCAQEFSARNVTVNAIAPGFIMTDMTHVLAEDVQNEFMSRIPLGRFGSVEEVADLVLFLASEPAGYITGQVVGINGGLQM